VRYLPPDANCLLSVADHCLRSRNYVNVMIAGKHALPQWLTMEQAIVHCTRGVGIWPWASNDQGSEPDIVMACCGDTPTLEILAATSILCAHLPALRVRVINVVDLMKLQSASEHPHGLDEAGFDALFTRDKPVVFGFQGYPGSNAAAKAGAWTRDALRTHADMPPGSRCIANRVPDLLKPTHRSRWQSARRAAGLPWNPTFIDAVKQTGDADASVITSGMPYREL
jgi:phosphoketolase